MDHTKQLAIVQQLPDRLKLYCPDLMNDLPTVQTWASRRIKEFEKKEFDEKLRSSLAEIVLITGGKMFEKGTQMYNAQIKTISKLLLYSFSFLSFEEIVNAFYLNSSGKLGEVHTHYGRELNVEFIGNVLASYKKFKQGIFNEYGHNLVKVVRGELPAPVPMILTDEDYINDKRRDIENAYQRLIKSMEMEERLFPEYFYDQLVADGAIESGLFERKLQEAKDKLAYEEHISKMEKEQAEKKYAAVKEDSKDGQDRYADSTHIGSHLNKLRFLARHGMLNKHRPAVTLSKQMIVKEFFLMCWRNNDEHIYGPKKR